MRLVAAGVSYRSSPMTVREAAAAAVADATPLLRYLVGHAGLSGVAVLSTCNRTDFYLTCAAAAAEQVAPRLAQYLDPHDRDAMSRYLTPAYDAEAASHVFRVAAGLESMVVGEAQVLGQVKRAHRAARAAGTLDARLDYVLRRAISTGKRVRTETRIGRGVGSLSEAALDVAGTVLGSLRGRGALLLGAGKMSALAARRLQAMRSPLLVSSRSESAEELAAGCGGRAVRLDELEENATRFDLIVASTSSPGVVLDAAAVARLQRRRGGRPLCIVDLAVPRDVDPGAASLPGVTLVDVDALGERLGASFGSREAEVPAAEAIVREEVERTMRVLFERDSVSPTIAALLRRAESVRSAEVERSLARMPELAAEDRRRVEAMSKSLVGKLLHAPVAHLREAADDPAVALTFREAFDLDR